MQYAAVDFYCIYLFYENDEFASLIVMILYGGPGEILYLLHVGGLICK